MPKYLPKAYQLDFAAFNHRCLAKEATFVNFRDHLFQTCIQVLKKLKEESFFKNLLGRDIFLTFTVPDFDFEEKELEKIIRELNDNPYKDEYLAWMRNL